MPATTDVSDRELVSRLCRPALLFLFQGFLQSANLSVQSAFVTRRLVLMHQAFSGHRIQHRNCSGISIRRSCFIARVNRRHYTLDVSAHHRTHASVAGTSCFRLRLGGIRQVSLLKKLKIQPNSIVRALSVVNQSGNDQNGNIAYLHTLEAPTEQPAATYSRQSSDSCAQAALLAQ